MIKSIFIFDNQMVAVLDEKGRQIAALQGRWAEKKKLILPIMAKNDGIEVWSSPKLDGSPTFLT